MKFQNFKSILSFTHITYMRAYPCSSTYTRILNLGEHISQPVIDSHPNITYTTINDIKITSLKLV